MTDGSQHDAREEFLAEAQELVEGLSRDLLLLDQAQRAGDPNPDLLHALFRSVHTLKGLSGMFGFQSVGGLAHVLEDLLDHLRLGRAVLDGRTLDVLFHGVEAFQRLLAAGDDASLSQAVDVEDFGTRVRAVIKSRARESDPLDELDIDQATLSVLTEYEEHRLRTHVQRGHRIVRVQIALVLEAIEQALEQLKQRVQHVGEVISYLPSSAHDDPSVLALEVLIATPVDDAELTEAIALPCSLSPVARRSFAPPRPSVRPAPSEGPPTHRQARPSASLALAPERPRGAALSLKSLTNVVRVDVRKLDHLMNAIAELASLRGAFSRLAELLPREARGEAHRTQRAFERRLGEVQTAVLDVRMVPLAQLFDKLAVAVRQLAREQDKHVQLVVRGADTEVDKLIAEEIADPLMHLVRNAIDHGVEEQARRTASGKSPVARLEVEAQQKGGQVVIDVRDDGQGIDPRAIARVAVERALLSTVEVAAMSDAELLDAVFMPGLSTRSLVSDVSGRGVGLDVVRNNAQRLGGSVQVGSELGQSTTFTITLPITLAIIRSLVFVVRGRTFCLPLAAVSEVTQLGPGNLRTIEGREVLDLRGATLPLVRLSELLELSVHAGSAPEQHVVVLSIGGRRLGLVVERLLGQQDVVIKALGRSLQNVRGLSGATDLGGHRLALVLDGGALLDEVLSAKSGMGLRAGGAT